MCTYYVNCTDMKSFFWSSRTIFDMLYCLLQKDDEEIGGIEGNNLMNQYADNNAMNSYDSDSD